LNILLSIAVSYAIGSVSPAFILGKVIGKVDIRAQGDGNAGTLNTIATLGIVPGLITGLFDVSKGILSLLVSRLVFGMEGNLLLIPIFASIAGHIFPFYLCFRGGQGTATAIGLILFFLVPMFATGRLPLDGLLILLGIIAVTAAVAQGVESIGLAVLPMLLFCIAVEAGRGFPRLVTILLAGFLCGTTLYNFIKKKLFRGFLATGANPWGILFRAAAVIVILLYVLSGKTSAIVTAASAGLASFVFDLYRLYFGGRDNAWPAFMTHLWKDAPTNRFSSVTILFVSSLSAVLIFPRDIALLVLSFLIGGSLFEDIFGVRSSGNGRIDRTTLKSCLSYLAGSLAAGYVVSTLLDLESLLLVFGALATPIAILISPDRRESFAVALLSGAMMAIIGFPV
jgi:glycerol-3-phosphate acyltransferase PlsY